MQDRREAFEIAGRRIPPRRRATVNLPLTALADLTPVTLSLHVVHGARPGPVMFVFAAVHGDEDIGVDIVHRLLRAPQLNNIAGTLLAVPIVNTFGFLSQSRYLPDRRDLNRSFPGSAGGSLASRLAYLFRTEIMARCSHGIDLHPAAIHPTNLPQIRVLPGRPQALKLAHAFRAGDPCLKDPRRVVARNGGADGGAWHDPAGQPVAVPQTKPAVRSQRLVARPGSGAGGDGGGHWRQGVGRSGAGHDFRPVRRNRNRDYRAARQHHHRCPDPAGGERRRRGVSPGRPAARPDRRRPEAEAAQMPDENEII